MSVRDGQPRITTQMRSLPIQTASSVKPSISPVQVVLVSVVLFLCGCSTLPNGRGWGQDATIKPGWQTIRESAVRAARSPYTWAPLAGALLLQIDDWDENISSWAARKTPVFGSQKSARDTSDVLRNLSIICAHINGLQVAGGKGCVGRGNRAVPRWETLVATAIWSGSVRPVFETSSRSAIQQVCSSCNSKPLALRGERITQCVPTGSGNGGD